MLPLHRGSISMDLRRSPNSHIRRVLLPSNIRILPDPGPQQSRQTNILTVHQPCTKVQIK